MIFISHGSEDVELAQRLVDLLKATIDLPDSAIRCTSVTGFGLKHGVAVGEQIRRDLRECSVVIGVLTRSSVASTYVQAELGAAWALEKLYPLVARGVGAEDLPVPLMEIHAAKMGVEKDLLAFIETVAGSVGRSASARSPEARALLDAFLREVDRLPVPARIRARKKLRWAMMAAAACSVVLAFLLGPWNHHPSIHLLTGNQGGAFYKVGRWLADRLEDQGYARVTLLTTQGSVDNCDTLENMEDNALGLAWSSIHCGRSAAEQRRKARIVASLYPEAMHLLVHRAADSSDEGFPDFRRRALYLGNSKSATRTMALLFLRTRYTAEEVAELEARNEAIGGNSFLAAAEKLRKGDIGAAFFCTGIKADAVLHALADGTVRLVNLDSDTIAEILKNQEAEGHFSYASLRQMHLDRAYEPNPYELSASGYKSKAVSTNPFVFNTVASDAVLLAAGAVDEQLVDTLLETFSDARYRKVLESMGISGTYLDNRDIINEGMIGRGLELHPSALNRSPWRSLWVKLKRFISFALALLVGASVVAAWWFSRDERAPS